MNDNKTSQEVGYNINGPIGKQCRDCLNYQPSTDSEGECSGHKVVALASCNYFTAK